MTSAIEVSPVTPVARTFRLSQAVERCVVPVLLIAGWEVFARSGYLPPALLPAPSAVLHALGDWVFGFDETTQTYSGHWTRDALASALRVFGGFALASALGILAGVAIGWSRVFRRPSNPRCRCCDPFHRSPGYRSPSSGSASPTSRRSSWFSRRVLSRPDEYHPWRENGRSQPRTGRGHDGSYRAPAADRHCVSAALPSIFSGLRIAIGSAWMLTVTAEMVAVKSGLGYVLWDSYYFLRYDLVLAAMISIGLLGYLSDLGLKAIMARVLHWQTATTVQGRAG
jgi:NitT/TauT family transport system permease protein